eukprot:15459690-Alexandrium_andersonii.AAC.1
MQPSGALRSSPESAGALRRAARPSGKIPGSTEDSKAFRTPLELSGALQSARAMMGLSGESLREVANV